MAVINWRERFIAFAIHFAATLLVACAAAALIFFVWFPRGLADVVGGASLFLLVVGCDVALGPLVSLVIYNSSKRRKELVFDYIVIGLIQFAALAYGVFVVAGSRPAFIVFDVDRIEIVTALELDTVELAKATDPAFGSVSVFGPRLASLKRPADLKEKNDLLFIEMSGVAAATFPKYYFPYGAAGEKIKSSCRGVDSLLEGSGVEEPKFRRETAKTGIDANRMCWLVAHHRFGFAVALLDRMTNEPIRFIAVSPEWVKARSEGH